MKYTDTNAEIDPAIGCRAKGTEMIVGKQLKQAAREGVCIEVVPVPQTDTGRWGENPKANGRRVVKELGILTP